MKINFPPILKNFALLISTCVLFFIVAEITCRLFYDESQNYQKEVWEGLQKNNIRQDKQMIYIDKDDQLVHKKANGQIDVNHYFNYSPTIKFDPAKNENEYRIIILGDSFTAGGGLSGDELYSSNLSSQLQKMLLGDKIKNFDKKIEVISFSDGGLNTYQEFILLRDLAIKYTPDIVILQYTDNDVGPMRSELGFNGSGLFISPQTNLIWLGKRIAPAFPFLNDSLNRFILRYSAFLRFLSYRTNLALLNNSQLELYASDKNSFDSIRSIKGLTEERSIPFIIIELPPASWSHNYCGDIPAPQYGGRQAHERLKNLTEELGVYFYNLCDYVDNIHSLKSAAEPEDGCHYGPEGYRLVAEILKNAVINIINNK